MPSYRWVAGWEERRGHSFNLAITRSTHYDHCHSLHLLHSMGVTCEGPFPMRGDEEVPPRIHYTSFRCCSQTPCSTSSSVATYPESILSATLAHHHHLLRSNNCAVILYVPPAPSTSHSNRHFVPIVVWPILFLRDSIGRQGVGGDKGRRG